MIKICKECGKEFEATNARQAYCSAKHYRPCPVCGELVYAKYLSDPARRCDKCKGAKSSKTKPLIAPGFKPVKQEANEEIAITEQTIERAKNLDIPDNVEEFKREDVLNNTVIAVYQSNTCCGFKWGHTYLIKTSWDGMAYVIEGVQDVTEGSICYNAMIRTSSMISFNQNFVRVE